jgi:hypothetical protein
MFTRFKSELMSRWGMASDLTRDRTHQQRSGKRDTKHIYADQARETANGNGEVDLIHGDFSETVTRA